MKTYEVMCSVLVQANSKAEADTLATALLELGHAAANENNDLQGTAILSTGVEVIHARFR